MLSRYLRKPTCEARTNLGYTPRTLKAAVYQTPNHYEMILSVGAGAFAFSFRYTDTLDDVIKVLNTLKQKLPFDAREIHASEEERAAWSEAETKRYLEERANAK